MESTIESKMKISKHKRKFELIKKKKYRSHRNVKLMYFRGYSKQ